MGAARAAGDPCRGMSFTLFTLCIVMCKIRIDFGAGVIVKQTNGRHLT